MTQSEIILACYEQNLRSARTPAMREFVEKRIAEYRASLHREPTVGPSWDREIPGEL